MKLQFSRQILGKKAQISSLIKIRPVEAELFHADGQMDTMNLISAFHNSANAPIKMDCLGHAGVTIGQTALALFTHRSGLAYWIMPDVQMERGQIMGMAKTRDDEMSRTCSMHESHKNR
jgi:hypothetical protein